MNDLVPEVSAWYQDVVSGSLFEVVALDEQSGTIEYQLVDGAVGEYEKQPGKTYTSLQPKLPRTGVALSN